MILGFRTHPKIKFKKRKLSTISAISPRRMTHLSSKEMSGFNKRGEWVCCLMRGGEKGKSERASEREGVGVVSARRNKGSKGEFGLSRL
jgi:hypothetical protein